MKKRQSIEPALSGVISVSRGRFHRVAYADWGPEAGDVVLCLHGLTRQGRDFDYLARTLVEQGKRVVCPDLAGRGRSGWLDNPRDYDVDQYVIDMAVLMASLHVGELDWVGTSLGGLIGMLIAGREDSPIRRLIINDVGPHLHPAAVFRIADYIRKAPARFPSLRAAELYFRDILAPFGEMSDEQWEHLTLHSVRPEPADGGFALHYDPGLTRAFRAPWNYEAQFWKAWDNINCPILVLRGAESDLLLPETADEMLERNRRATLIELPNCGHAPALADDEQLRVVSDWLGSTQLLLRVARTEPPVRSQGERIRAIALGTVAPKNSG